MNEFSSSRLAMGANRRIARRQQLARWGARLILPTSIAIWLLAPRHESLALAAGGLLVVEIALILIGEVQRCPRCEASLVIRRGWRQDLAPTCPECDCPID